MTNDRELLEAAAKAAGIWIIRDRLEWTECGDMMVAGGAAWNPLTDDADALRLAVKLGLSIERDFDRIDVYRERDLLATEFLYEKPAPTDIYAATRRAIVRAAAALAPTP